MPPRSGWLNAGNGMTIVRMRQDYANPAIERGARDREEQPFVPILEQLSRLRLMHNRSVTLDSVGINV